MRDALICEPLRTPVGRFGGVFRDVSVTELTATVIRAVIERTGVPVDSIDDVLLGQAYPNGDAPALGRVAALDAGLPVQVPGLQIDRRCGAGLQAVIEASMQVQTGAADLVLAGGAESMSQAELYSTTLRWGARSGGAMLEDRLDRSRVSASGVEHPVPGGMVETAESLRALKPIMVEADPEATITAGNASGQNDGAAICIVTHAQRAAELGLRPLARLVSWAVAGVPPRTMGIGPAPSTRRALARAELSYGLETMCIGGGQGLAAVFENVQAA